MLSCSLACQQLCKKSEQEQGHASVSVLGLLACAQWNALVCISVFVVGKAHKVCHRLVLWVGEEDLSPDSRVISARDCRMLYPHQPRKGSTLLRLCAMIIPVVTRHTLPEVMSMADKRVLPGPSNNISLLNRAPALTMRVQPYI